MIEVHKVPKDIADNVERWVTGTKIPWFYFNDTLGPSRPGSVKVDTGPYVIEDMPRLSHYFFPNSRTPNDDNNIVMPLIEWIKVTLLSPGYELSRAMGNLTTPLNNSQYKLNVPHKDSDIPDRQTFLYYVNSSDGKTIFFENGKIIKEVEPVKGTGVLFPSNTPHAGQLPYHSRSRYIINITFNKRV